MKKSFSSLRKRQLQVFSQMMQMKFKPRSNVATTSIVAKNKQIIEKQQKKHTGQLQFSQSTLSRMTNRDKKLKYLHSLSPEYFLIGNENQIDMINILGMTHGFVDTDYCWSLCVPGPIDCLSVQLKKNILAIVSDKKLYFYRYNLKKSKQEPEFIKQFDIKPEVKYMQFPKDTLLALFYQKQFEIYNVDEVKKIGKKCQKAYNQPANFVLFAVPQAVQNSLKVFFIEQQYESKTFGLFFIKIAIQFTSIEVQKPQKVYDIKKNLKKMIVIQNFSKDIIFMNIGAQILAAKNGFILDSASVNVQSGNAKLRYISNQRLMHISDKKIQIYKMNILTNFTPNKIQVKPMDALELADKPYEAQFFGIISSSNDNFTIFFQNISQYNIYTKGQATYWFASTQSIPLQQKIQKIFDTTEEISKMNPQILEEKCDMARKMGLNQKQLYLQLWNRSNKNSIQDYQFILATRNYKTIHIQIQKKLKKQSMSYRQLLKIEQSCLQILKQSVFGPKCTQQGIQQFLVSHSFIKKLNLFRDIELYRKRTKKSTIRLNDQSYMEEQNNCLMINIQQYYEHKQFDIKNYLVQKIIDFCVYDKETKLMEIRMMLRTFKFVYRVIYKQILDEIIKICKGKIIMLLNNIPQILPYENYKNESKLGNEEDSNLFQGIWNQIKRLEWENNLFVENISTIDNKQVVGQFVKSIWYRRYWLTGHELINLTKEKIIEINRTNNSQLIFYYFISKVFELVPDEATQFEIIYYLEEHYERIPDHLKGKIFLHYNLHKFYVENHAKAKLPFIRLDQFLNLNDAKLFQYFFTQEKHTKNCILRYIKKIYEQTCQEGQGLNLFNEGLLAYFKSDLSQISDLKYLLNRMNNQKTEFHQANLSIYEVLVRAMEFKLRLGSQQDIPIDQVLIYIQNIPISEKDNWVMRELQVVYKINQEAQRFKKMKLNMTLKQIIDSCEDVISKVIDYQFETNNIRKIKDEQNLKSITYKILAQVQIVKQKIYGVQYVNLPFFIYLTKLLEEISQIKLANFLLADEVLLKYFPFDNMMKQNLVLFMYKWAFSKNPAFVVNAEYVRELITLLPEDNQHRLFIESEIQFAISLSARTQPLEYPISTQSNYPRINQLSQILKALPIDHVLTVDIDLIFKCMSTMETITLKQIFQEQQSVGFSTIDKINPHQVYSAFAQKIIEQNHLNDAIAIIKRILTFQIPNKRYNMIYFIFLIEKLSCQLNDESKHVMIKMISYCYDQPQLLFEFIEYYFNSKQTVLQKSRNLRKMMEQKTKDRINFVKDNFLFISEAKTALLKEQHVQNSKKLINSTFSHIKQAKLQFKNLSFEFLYTILCNQPYLAAKYIQYHQYQMNLKTIRLFLSFLVQQAIFDENAVIDFSKKIFEVILQSNVKGKQISLIINNISKFSFNLQEIKQLGIFQDVDKKIQKTLKSFDKKKKSLNKKISSAAQRDELQTPPYSVHLQIINPDQLSSKQPSQYIFSDSDNEPEQEPGVMPKTPIRRKKKQSIKQFDKKTQRKRIMKRKNSFFADKSSQRSKSRNEQNEEEVSQISQLNKGMSLKVPDVRPNKIYVKRISQNISKKNISAITQKQENSQNQSKLKKIQKKQSFSHLSNNEQSKISRQQSQYSINQIAQAKQEDPAYRIKDLIMKKYQKQANKIDFDVLSKHQQKEDFNQSLKDVAAKIYIDKQIENSQKLKIIKLISQKYPKVGINIVFLAVYENILKLEEKYNLDLPIDRMLPVEGIFIDSKSFDDLFKVILPRIVQIATDETIYKLSKLISLGFRKNIYQSEISFEYIKKIIIQFSTQHSEVELNIRFEIMKSLLSKISILHLKQKAIKLLEGIIANPGLKQKVIQNVVQSVRRRGNNSAAEQIKNIMIQ